mgnify:CR=1 FL=1
MKNYLFKLIVDGKQTVEEITEQHFYYKIYDKFLEKFHMININDNDDFIPYIKDKEVLIILRTDLNIEDLKFDVFDCLQDYLCKIA